MSDLQKEIDEMIGEITAAPSSEKAAFGEEETPKEEPKEAPSAEKEEPKEEAKPEEPTKGDVIEEVTETPQEPPAQPQEDPRILAMQETINQLSQRLLQAGVVTEAKPPQPTEPPAVPSQVAPQPQPQIDLDMGKFQILPEGVEFEDIVNDKSVFERFMRDLLSRYEVSRVRRDTLVAPQLVSRQVQYFLNLNEAVRQFYDTNKDLVNMKPLVGAYTNRIVAEHPDWSLPQVMEEAAKATRQAVGLGVAQAKAQTTQPRQPVKPSFVKQEASSRTQPTVKQTELQKQIDELITGY